MTIFESLFTGLTLGVIAGMSPGPDTIVVLEAVGRGGLRAGWRCAAGIGLGLVLHAGAAFVVLGTMAGGGPLLLGLQGLGAAYLAYLGCCLLRRGEGRTHPRPEVSERSGRGDLARGFFTNALNPKAILFFTSVVTQAIGGHGTTAGIVAALAGTVLGPPLWFAALSAIAAYYGRGRLSLVRMSALRTGAGVLFLLFALDRFLEIGLAIVA